MRQGSILTYLKPQIEVTTTVVCEPHEPTITVTNNDQSDTRPLIEVAVSSSSTNTKELLFSRTRSLIPAPICLNDPRATITNVQEVHIPRLRSITSTLFPVRYSDKFFLECLDSQRDDTFAFVALYADKVVGWIRCRREPLQNVENEKQCQLYIQAIGILAPYRSLGLASALLSSVIDAATRQNYSYSSVYAHVWEANIDALDWYSKRGFRQIILQPGYYRRLRPSGAWIVRKELSLLH